MLFLIDKANRWAGGLAMALSGIMISATLFEVVVRRAFNAPTIWSNDVVTMSAGAYFLLGAGMTLLHDRHIKIDIFVQRLPASVRHLMLAAGFLLAMFPTVAVIGYTTGLKALRSFQAGTRETVSAWEPLLWPYQAALCLALTLFALQLLAQGIRHLLAVHGGQDLASVYAASPHSGEPQS